MNKKEQRCIGNPSSNNICCKWANGNARVNVDEKYCHGNKKLPLQDSQCDNQDASWDEKECSGLLASLVPYRPGIQTIHLPAMQRQWILTRCTSFSRPMRRNARTRKKKCPLLPLAQKRAHQKVPNGWSNARVHMSMLGKLSFC